MAKIEQKPKEKHFTLDDAIKLATLKHKGQKDMEGKPYILHPLNLMEMLIDEQAKMVAVLHDIVEDTPVTFSKLRSLGCPKTVLEALKLVTHSRSYDHSEKSYLNEMQAIADSQNQLAIDVKWADLTNNIVPSRVPNPTDKDHKRWAKYKRAKEILRPHISKYLIDLK